MKKMILLAVLGSLHGSAMPAAETNRVEIDVKQTGAVISPLLFGHNLEVTRRAIWRGLGAEMVANRKFAAVTKGLPKRWYAIPDAGSVVMLNDKAKAVTNFSSSQLKLLAGRHSTEIKNILGPGHKDVVAVPEDIVAIDY